ncbi:MAG TPA: hypothetical protein VHG93_09870 [Longimicrobium sp.]|nr:hypothetical protein [Longimicrobium sp.]
MRKMKLDVEALAVDSFGTETARKEMRGTVRGNAVLDVVTVRVTCYTNCGGSTCDYTGSPCVAC